MFLNSTLFTTLLDKIVGKFRSPPPPIQGYDIAVIAVVAKAHRALILIVMGMESEIPGPGCSNRVKVTKGLVRNLNLDMKA